MEWLREHKAALLAFAVAVAYWPGILAPAFAPRWAAIAIGVPLVSRFDPKEVYAPIFWLMIAGVAWAAFSLNVSPDKLGGALELFFLVALCGAFVMGSGLDSLDGVMTGMALGIGVSSLICIPQFFGWTGLPQLSSPSGLFLNRELLAEVAAPVFLWAILRPRWLLAALTIIPITLCDSRVALFVTGAGLLYAWHPRPSWVRLLSASALIGAGISAIFVFGIGKTASAAARMILWGATAISITPLGQGLGWFQAAHPVEMFSHSDVLQSVAEFGVGSIFFIAIPIVIFMRGRGTNAERAAFVAICIEAIVSFPLHVPATGFLAAVLAGSLACSRAPVCVDGPNGRNKDERHIQWDFSTRWSAYGRSRFSSFAFPVRSYFARYAKVGTAAISI